MKFIELRLELAVNRADVPGDPITNEQRRELALAVFQAWVEMCQDTYFPFTIEEVAHASVRVRKRGKGKICAWQVAAAHNQWECFWAHRGKGPCSDQVEGGHIVARAAGAGDLTIENGIIECRAHNNQRRERTIEEYLLATDTT